MQLRPYQIQIVDEVVSSDRNRLLIVLPTGGGKTIIMAAICDKKNQKTLLLAHRDELLYQAKNRIKDYAPHIKTSICSEGNTDFSGDVVIGSVQTLCRRIDQVHKFNPSVIMVDEAHHAQAETYKQILHSVESAQWIGVTATPDRSDNKDIEQIFGKPIQYSRTIRQMIQDGFLSPLISKKLFTHVDLGTIRSNGEDFSCASLAERVDIKERNEFVVDKYIEHASDRKAIFFGCNVAHAENLNEIFLERGVKSDVIHAGLPMEERREILQKFSSRELDVLVNCLILTEGFDDPEVSCIGMTRPTKSYSLYTQCIGRGLRIHPTKKNCLILDFTDVVHNKKKPITLEEAVPRDKEEKDKEEKSKSGATTRNETLEFEIDTINAKFNWHDLKNGIYALSDKNSYLYIYQYDGNYYYDHYTPKMEKIYISQPFSEFDLCYHQAIDYATKKMDKTKFDDRHLEYCASKKQISYIRALGYRGSDPTTLGQANMLIDYLILKKSASRIKMPVPKKEIQREYICVNNVHILNGACGRKMIIRKGNGKYLVEEWDGNECVAYREVENLTDAKKIGLERAEKREINPIITRDINSPATQAQMRKIREEFPWDYRENLTKGEASEIISVNILEEFLISNKIKSEPEYPVPCII